VSGAAVPAAFPYRRLVLDFDDESCRVTTTEHPLTGFATSTEPCLRLGNGLLDVDRTPRILALFEAFPYRRSPSSCNEGSFSRDADSLSESYHRPSRASDLSAGAASLGFRSLQRQHSW